MDAHTPYTPSPTNDIWSTKEDWQIQKEVQHFRWEYTSGQRPLEELNNLVNLYDGAIRQADKKVEKIVSGLERRGILDDTLLVITSDHGEGFGEPSRIRPNQKVVGHTVGVHESQLHVPLLVRPPGKRKTADRVTNELASLTRFPAVVRHTIKGAANPENHFITDNKVLATQLAIGQEDRSLARQFGTDIESISGQMRVAYEQVNNTVYKHMSWSEYSNTVKIEEDGKYRTVPDANTDEILTSSFSHIEELDIKERHSEDVKSEVKDRLSDLGYT
jgi:phosphoglycerol transferase MdoB-like AlkP superfamily enzyme